MENMRFWSKVIDEFIVGKILAALFFGSRFNFCNKVNCFIDKTSMIYYDFFISVSISFPTIGTKKNFNKEVSTVLITHFMTP